MEVAQELLRQDGHDLLNLYTLSVQDMQKIPGIGQVKAIQLKCIAELSKRMAKTRYKERICLGDPGSIASYYMEDMRHESRERTMVLLFDAKCRLLEKVMMSVGSATAALVSPREIFLAALDKSAIQIVLMHNHPSGDPSPSAEDDAVTKRVAECGALLGIPLVDHIIIGDRTYYSYRECKRIQSRERTMTNNVYGIDLGTCNMKIYCKASNKIMNEKNTIALVNKNEMYAYGDDAYAMYEKAPETIQVTFPVVGGVIADFNNLQVMLQTYLEAHAKGKLRGAEFIVAVPTDITDVEKRAFFDMFYKSKLKPKSVLLCEKPIADAVGLGLNVNEPTGIMVVDIGADTTEISVISLGGLVLSDLLHSGGNKIDESIITYVKRKYNLVIGQKTAQSMKETLGSGIPGNTQTMVVVGRDVVSGLPIEMEMSGAVVYEAIKDNLNTICNSIKMILEKTPPELARDIIHSGIYITGGSSQIHDLDQLFRDITGIEINTCEEPEECVVRGLLKIVSDAKFKHLAFSMKNKILL